MGISVEKIGGFLLQERKQKLSYKDIQKNLLFDFNYKNKCDGLKLLKNLKDNTIACCFFDPQYRGILDKLSYGNEGERQKQRFLLKQMDQQTISNFIIEIERVLKSQGHLFLWIDKFHLCEGIHSWVEDLKLEVVDLITWDKSRMGMGYRTRRQCEYLCVIQKKPTRAKDVWKIRNIRDIWTEKIVNKNHAHSKPINLQKRLIESVTDDKDIVIDPCAGGFSVLEACRLSNRTFLGCDIEC